jgi:hypothetical protein
MSNSGINTRNANKELVSLKYMLSLIFSNAPHVVHRMTHEKLVDSHNTLMAAYIESIKRPCVDVRVPHPDPSSAIAMNLPTADSNESGSDTLDSYSQSEYPNIHYWTKGKWVDFKNEEKNSSIQGSKAGP